MLGKDGGLVVIGENFNSTRKIKATNPRVIEEDGKTGIKYCLLYTSPSPRDLSTSRMPSSA